MVTEEQKEELIKEYTKEEVKQALWAIDDNKSPGPDGYGSKFFKDCWGLWEMMSLEGYLNISQMGKC
ncbi:hypothetical protein KY290_020491 [Solanum tuberosum]|uniref:Uncharacterized protein n=1 Tax=Solanum tuberosum TaxID=4113 RepID=A0ABQ7V0T5_SOLTU|nr:hypothetical protein KY290_020491 [Solanum tuberosum]